MKGFSLVAAAALAALSLEACGPPNNAPSSWGRNSGFASSSSFKRSGFASSSSFNRSGFGGSSGSSYSSSSSSSGWVNSLADFASSKKPGG